MSSLHYVLGTALLSAGVAVGVTTPTAGGLVLAVVLVVGGIYQLRDWHR